MKISIGLPIYNGETYLAETLDALLGQTCGDFELIISDNASTDATPDICAAYAQRDSRIRFVHHAENRGAAWNFNHVFELAQGTYFKWAAGDDLCAPEFLARCVDVLDNQPDVVLCFTRALAIDREGNVVKEYPAITGADAQTTRKRFAAMVVGAYPFIPVFGLGRRDVLAKTSLIGAYSGSDRPLVGEIALHGRLHEVPEFLFSYRIHPKQSWGSNRSRHEQQAWYDPGRLNKITFPHWRLLLEHERTVVSSPISLTDKLQCQVVMAKWMRRRWRYLANNLLLRDAG